MRVKFSIFGKMAFLICALLIPIVLLFSYVNDRSSTLVEDEIRKSKLKQLSVFMNQIGGQIEQLSMFSLQLMRDSDVLDFQLALQSSRGYDRDRMINAIYEKLLLGSISTSFQNRLAFYSPASGLVISTSTEEPFDKDAFLKDVSAGWRLHRSPDTPAEDDYFTRYTVEPYSAYAHPDQANAIIRTSFPVDSLRRMLDDFKRSGGDDPFLFSPEDGMIGNRSMDGAIAAELQRSLAGMPLPDVRSMKIALGGQNYMISSTKIPSLGWYLVDYVPIGSILAPIREVSKLFYVSVGLLLVLSILALLLLYRNVQIPIRQLIFSLREIKHGNYAVRMFQRRENEFSFVFSRFNEMAQEIQRLVEKVYMEEIRTREATLKQLQSQINPHFLYNCLFYVQSMIRLGALDLAEKMALNLGEYYRYNTRVEKQTVTLRSELGFVGNYLEIQQMRMKRFEYEIDVPEEMMELPVPRLIVQPAAENAIVHGIERKPGRGRIAIRGRQEDAYNYLVVEDDGAGMSQDALVRLMETMDRTMDESMGCGVWNVHQRLKIQYGDGSGIGMSLLPEGGIRVTLAWTRLDREVGRDVPAARSG
ncbi:cache domain-containing sensor histidine kinase [Paenibacillus sp. GCM10023250]|uniref:cache domain-containing sensor histidine kinase n=1 Tax=Paenibacillus sp. GCM10023250 TaxID=3252648 RepID=UPI00361047AE